MIVLSIISIIIAVIALIISIFKKGKPGPQGIQGMQGPKGDKGIDGKSWALASKEEYEELTSKIGKTIDLPNVTINAKTFNKK